MKHVTIPSILLDQMATVYGRDASGATKGAYNTVVTSNLPVRLANLSLKGAPTAEFRKELASVRRLVWGPSTTIDEHAQVEIGGVRYNVRAGTFQKVQGPSGEQVYQSCDVVRAQ